MLFDDAKLVKLRYELIIKKFIFRHTPAAEPLIRKEYSKILQSGFIGDETIRDNRIK